MATFNFDNDVKCEVVLDLSPERLLKEQRFITFVDLFIQCVDCNALELSTVHGNVTMSFRFAGDSMEMLLSGETERMRITASTGWWDPFYVLGSLDTIFYLMDKHKVTALEMEKE